jgi:hypothetical protein
VTFDVSVRHGRLNVELDAPIWVVTLALLIGASIARWLVIR